MTPAAPLDRPTTGAYLTIADICTRYPGKGGRPLHRATPLNWILSGCPARNGTRVQLAATRCGSQWLVAPAALDAFFAALAALPASLAAPKTATLRADVDRRTAASRACEVLARRGA